MSRTKLALSLVLVMLGLAGLDGWLQQDVAGEVSQGEGRVRVYHDGTSYPPK